MVYDSLSAITHQQLRVFAAVAQEGTFVRAGRTLLLSEPAVSNHIRALERLVGAKLVVRSPGRRNVELTEAGQALVQVCHSTFQTLEMGVQSIRERYGSESATITIGAAPDVSGYILPRLIMTFRKTHPSIAVHIEASRNIQTLDSLRHGRIQLGVVLSPIDESGLVCEPFADAIINLIGPLGHRLAGDTPAELAELADEPMIASDELSTPRLAVDRLAASAGVTLNVVMSAQDVHARVQAVINGFGIAAVPMSALLPHLGTDGRAPERFSVLNVKGFPIRLQRKIAYRPDAIPQAAREFVEHIHQNRAAIESAGLIR